MRRPPLPPYPSILTLLPGPKRVPVWCCTGHAPCASILPLDWWQFDQWLRWVALAARYHLLRSDTGLSLYPSSPPPGKVVVDGLRRLGFITPCGHSRCNHSVGGNSCPWMARFQPVRRTFMRCLVAPFPAFLPPFCHCQSYYPSKQLYYPLNSAKPYAL